jgi:hypothetical protein
MPVQYEKYSVVQKHKYYSYRLGFDVRRFKIERPTEFVRAVNPRRRWIAEIMLANGLTSGRQKRKLRKHLESIRFFDRLDTLTESAVNDES